MGFSCLFSNSEIACLQAPHGGIGVAIPVASGAAVMTIFRILESG